ncbi:MAG: sensor histidine kinase [Chlorobi bacterium]|nr:sensor histidine kinase [Chlorobiota bacterium]MCI0715723.1 sensor histidine kinase [Chlorobiota bacterium]
MQNERALNESNERLHSLAAHLQTVREDERTSVAREIHDQLGQELTALKMDISFLKKRIESTRDNPEWNNILENLKSMTEVIDMTVNSVRRIARELRPDILDKLGLIEAIGWHAEEFEKRTGIKCILNLQNGKIKFDENLSTTIYRIVQECLTNVARHSAATEVRITIQSDDSYLHLRIADNGKGISEDEINNTKSLGLVGIRERAYSAGGELKIEGEKNKGTKLKIIIPLNEHAGKYY